MRMMRATVGRASVAKRSAKAVKTLERERRDGFERTEDGNNAVGNDLLLVHPADVNPRAAIDPFQSVSTSLQVTHERRKQGKRNSPPDHLLERPTRPVDARVRLGQHIPRMLNLLSLASQIAQDPSSNLLRFECKSVRLL